MTVNMFAALENTTRLVDEGNPDEAYRVMKTAVSEDDSGFARTFLLQWARHIETEEENQQNKFAEILIFLRDDFPELASKEDTEIPSGTNHAMPLWLAPLSKQEPVVTTPREDEVVFVRASPFLSPGEEPEPVIVKTPQKPVVENERETQEVETNEEATQEQAATDEGVTQEGTQEEPVSQEEELSDYELLTKDIPDTDDEPVNDEQQAVGEEVVEAAVAVELHADAEEDDVPVADEQPVHHQQEQEEEQTPATASSEVPETPEPPSVPEQPVDNPPKPVEKRKKSVEKQVVVQETEPLTLTFYEWQMAAIQKAAMKENVDEGVLLTRILQTRKLDPLLWSRYKQGKTTSPAHRITISVPHKTKVRLEKDKDSEGIKTTTKFVRKMLFGTRAEKA